MRVTDRIARGPAQIDTLHIPWVAIALWQASVSGLAIAAIVQRAGHPLLWTMLAALLTIFPGLYYFGRGRDIPAVAAAPPLIVAITILVWADRVAFNIAPFVLVFGLGAVAAQQSTKICAATAAVFAAVLIGAALTHRLEGGELGLGLLLTGLALGHRIATQRRLVAAERRTQETLREHAASEERRRIAREIHDMVAHSLSITLLHVTGARRELQYAGDTNEAISALSDAERLGRQAMADIRRTIGLLDARPTSLFPEPGINDVPALIQEFQNAGLTIDYRITGDCGHVLPSVGLSVYRICQESLANIVKHTPTATAEMDLDISYNTIALSISNNITAAQPSTVSDPYGGAGIRGMKYRVQLLGGRLTAGPQRSRWTVQAHIPLPAHQSSVE